MLPVPNNNTVYWQFLEGKKPREFTAEPTGELLKQGAWYFVPNELGEWKNEKGHLRDHRNVVGLNAFFLDFDTGTKEEQMNTILAMPLRPTAIVESGRGYHAYFAIEDGHAITAPIWKAVQTAMAKRHGSDTAVSDTGRLMRLPGSWHTKDGSPLVEVKIIEYHEGVAYTVREVMEAYPVRVESAPTVYTLGHIHEVERPRETLLQEGQRHRGLLTEAGRLYGRSAEKVWPDVRAVLASWYLRSCVKMKDNWQKEVEDVCFYIEYAERSKR